MVLIRIDDFLRRLHGVHAGGDNNAGHKQYMARCPAHDDKAASLSVTSRQDGAILLYCHAGCEVSDILSAMGLEMRDLYPAPQPSATTARGQEAEYIYRDRAGNQILKKTRLRNPDGSKSFCWKHYANGQWETGRAGITPPLYGTETIRAGERLYVVEGEKDADTMHRLGLPCVSLADGASSKWHEDYSHSFADLDVYIVPDNDTPGADYAKMIAGHLLGVAKTVSILDLAAIWAEIPPKGDISDYAQAAGDAKTRDALRDMVRRAVPFQQPKSNGFLSCFQTLDCFVEEEAEWLVPNLIPKEQITTFAADGGLGKTTVWCNLLAAISAGKPCFLDPPGYIRKPELVAFLTTEDSVGKKLKRKLREAGADESNIITPDFAKDTTGQLRKLKFGTPELAAFIRLFHPAVCVFDPVQSFVPATINMGSRNAMRDCMAPLIELGEETGTTFIIVCHTNKRKGAYGRDRLADSADIWDISRSVLMLGYTETSGVRYISNEKNNYAELQETRLFSLDDMGHIHLEGTSWKRDREYMLENAVSTSAPVREDCKAWILNQLDAQGGTMATKALEALAKAAGYSEHTLRRAKEELKQDKDIQYRQVGAPSEKVWYVERITLPDGW